MKYRRTIDVIRNNDFYTDSVWQEHKLDRGRIEYDLNSQGFRAPEFDQIDWANSLVILGCSHVFGVGVDQSQTLSDQFSRIINRPVVNMGVSSASNWISYMNLLQLLEHKKPWGVVFCWTDHHRIAQFTDDSVRHLGPFNDQDGLYTNWNQHEQQSQIHTLMIKKSLDLITAEMNIPLFHCSRFGKTADLVGCFRIRMIDQANDDLHPGEKSNLAAARCLSHFWYDKIKNS